MRGNPPAVNYTSDTFSGIRCQMIRAGSQMVFRLTPTHEFCRMHRKTLCVENTSATIGGEATAFDASVWTLVFRFERQMRVLFEVDIKHLMKLKHKIMHCGQSSCNAENKVHE